MNTDYSYLDRNVKNIKELIHSAAASAGRDDKDIMLMAAVKSADANEINYIHDALGINDIGENRVQQLIERYDALHKENLHIHFIGSLQTNKVKYIIDKVDLIHSLDSLRLAAEIDRQAAKRNIVANVLVEINSGAEESKGGISSEDALSFCKALEQFKSIKLCGFMTMAPRCENKSDYHAYFNSTRETAMSIWRSLALEGAPVLSMGMSESFCEAVECGATLVRVGRQMFAK